MSSGFSAGVPDFFTAGRRSATNNLNPQPQFSFRSPLSGALPDPTAQIHRPESIGKRSLGEFQQQQQPNNRLGLGFHNSNYLRNVKPRPNYYNYSPVEFPPVSSVSNSMVNRNTNIACSRIPNNSGLNTMMNHRLQELEKQLLGDEEDEEEEGGSTSVVTNSEWSETIQNLVPTTQKPISPTSSSSSSSCSSTLVSPQSICHKQTLIDSAEAISDGRLDFANEILTRLQNTASNMTGTSEQRLVAYMISALKSRLNNTKSDNTGLYSKEHAVSTQMLYDVSPCFKLGFMAANLAILEAASEQGFQKIHVVDFDIGQGGQYVHLLHALAAVRNSDEKSKSKSSVSLSITAFADFGEENNLNLKSVGEGLKSLANKIGVALNFYIKHLNLTDLSRENLEVQPDEALALNFAFKLYKLPDESVTTENLRDELLRRVKALSPTVMTVVEQEMNGNTAPLVARVRDACDYYGALFDSLDATVARESSERVRIEEGLSRKMRNSVAREGRERVERCEVFGKWRARMGMAGFKAREMSSRAAESLRSKLNSGTRGNPGFTVSEQCGGICFGWMGRTLTVASAWR